MLKIFFIGIMAFFLWGCQTASVLAPKSNKKEEKESLISVAESLSGKTISEQQLKTIYQDPQSRSAVDSVKQSFDTKKRMKYSPRTGRRYTPSMERCPDTGVKLEWLEE